MCLERARSGERRNPVMKEPAINAIWKIKRGVGSRYVSINGADFGHILARSQWE
jgi:hypothetical protein